MKAKSNSSKVLAVKKCVACEGLTAPLRGIELERLGKSLGRRWKMIESRLLEREFKFKNFREALDFVVKIGDLAEAQGHHPDIYLSWGKVKVTLWTHKVGGLTDNDFALAAMIERLDR